GVHVGQLHARRRLARVGYTGKRGKFFRGFANGKVWIESRCRRIGHQQSTINRAKLLLFIRKRTTAFGTTLHTGRLVSSRFAAVVSRALWKVSSPIADCLGRDPALADRRVLHRCVVWP